MKVENDRRMLELPQSNNKNTMSSGARSKLRLLPGLEAVAPGACWVGTAAEKRVLEMGGVWNQKQLKYTKTPRTIYLNSYKQSMKKAKSIS